MYPRRSATVHMEVVGEDVCLYDWPRRQVHALNPTAARVWRLCDGKTPEAAMAARLAPEWGAEQAAALVHLALEEFAAKHLLDNDATLPTAAGPVAGGLSRRQAMKRLGLAAAALPVVTSIVAPRAMDAASVVSGSQTFAYTGAAQNFTVPTGVTAVTIQAAGAQGGTGNYGGSTPGPGGQGGSTTATLTVTAGEILAVYVGGGTSGFNGGGSGGTVGSVGGAGGGASDVRQGGTGLANRVVVAGGGGGGGGSNSDGTGGAGGAGGTTTAATGTSGGGGGGGGGYGGTQTAGGSGGANNFGGSAQNGTLGQGGAGASNDGCGGGGGGGYYGGGGGGAGFSGVAYIGGGGGGGGSSYADASVTTSVSMTQGTQSGNGQVIISW